MKRGAWYLIVSLLCIALGSQAQTNSRLGRFRVDQTRGCAPFTVNITINPPSVCNSTNSCDMFFGDTSTSQNLTFSHTYTQAGTFMLQIVFGTSGTDDIQIQVFPNTPPQFEIYACSNREVSVNITDTNYTQYIVNFNDASPEVTWTAPQPRPRHIYATAGNQSVSVRGRNIGAFDNCNSNTQTINVATTLPPPVITQLLVIDNASVQLTYTAQSGVLYRLEVATNGASSFQLLKTSYNITTETISGLQPDNNYYCFRLGASDPCSNTPPVYSNVICSANFDLSIQNNSNNVTWTTNTTGSPTLRLTRTNQGSSLTTTVTNSPYADTNITCGTDYCYQLFANYSNGSRSTSLQKCGTAISTDIPAPVDNITLVVNQNSVDIQWLPVTGFTAAQYTVSKSGGALYNLLTTTTGLQVADPDYTIGSTACYKISYTDVCGNISPQSAEACPIFLTGYILSDNSISLTWTAYLGWRDGVNNYVVEKYSSTGNQLLQTFPAGTNLSFIDNTQDLNTQSYIYIIKAQSVQPGLPEAVSNPVVVIKNPNLFYPTAFTPNGDNLNDIFNVYGQYIDAFEMNIFNRWGELMYSTTELDQGWDGYFKGNPMPEGTYTFVADITDLAGRTFKRSGSVMLLRKR
jgi:gliding motility-associated-like protein